MKYILTFLMLIGIVYAQEPTYTPMKGNYKFKGIKVDSLFLIPAFSDTAAANTTNLDQIAGAMIRTGNDFWMRNASTTAWLQNVNVGDGANPFNDFDLQYVTNNGDSTTHNITISDAGNLGFDGHVRIGLNGSSPSPATGSFLELTADGVNPQYIIAYNEKSDGNNYLKMESAGLIFSFTNGGGESGIGTNGNFNLSSSTFMRFDSPESYFYIYDTMRLNTSDTGWTEIKSPSINFVFDDTLKINDYTGKNYIISNTSTSSTVLDQYSGFRVYNIDLDPLDDFVLEDNSKGAIYRFTLTDSDAQDVELPSAASYPNVVFHISRNSTSQDGTLSIISGSDIEDETGTFDTSFDLDAGEKCTWASDGTDWILINYSN